MAGWAAEAPKRVLIVFIGSVTTAPSPLQSPPPLSYPPGVQPQLATITPRKEKQEKAQDGIAEYEQNALGKPGYAGARGAPPPPRPTLQRRGREHPSPRRVRRLPSSLSHCSGSLLSPPWAALPAPRPPSAGGAPAASRAAPSGSGRLCPAAALPAASAPGAGSAQKTPNIWPSPVASPPGRGRIRRDNFRCRARRSTKAPQGRIPGGRGVGAQPGRAHTHVHPRGARRGPETSSQDQGSRGHPRTRRSRRARRSPPRPPARLRPRSQKRTPGAPPPRPVALPPAPGSRRRPPPRPRRRLPAPAGPARGRPLRGRRHPLALPSPPATPGG